MTKRILHLTLMKIYFEQIVKGLKKEEYRDIKPYWTKRLEGREYDEIWFKNGYSKGCPFMRIEYLGIEKRTNEYALKLGKILELKNWE